MKQKRPMFLLEILIALSLVALCIFPFIKQPQLMQRSELQRLERVECDRIAAWTYTEIRQKFLNKEFRWEQIPSLKKESRWMELSNVVLRMAPLPCPSLARGFKFKTLEEKQELDGRIHRFVAVKIKIGAAPCEHEFTYRLLLTKYPNSSSLNIQTCDTLPQMHENSNAIV